jgi:hypothetical protein
MGRSEHRLIQETRPARRGSTCIAEPQGQERGQEKWSSGFPSGRATIKNQTNAP